MRFPFPARRFAAVLLSTILGFVAGCSAHGPTPDPDATGPVVPFRPGAVPQAAHVVVVIFENKGADQIVGSDSAPYLTGLAHRGAYFTNSHGIAHPSQPNYVALLSGSTHGVTGDSCPQDLQGAANLGSELIAAGHTFAGYAEGMPRTGFTGCSAAGGRYRRKHNPWADFSNIPASANRPLSRFPRALSDLPTVSFVVPDMCHDMHDCSVATGDRWARDHLHRYVAWARTHHSLLVVTFDEDDGSSANRIPTILVGPMVRPGRYGQLVDHYNVLRTLQQMYRLRPLGLAARARPLAAWRR